jgi:hypothetical protein
MEDADVAREVTQAIQVALDRNRRIETIVIAILATLAFTGIGLVIYGAAVRSWEAVLPGTISELAIVMPIRYLLRIRNENVRLEAMPQMIRLADTPAKKKSAFDTINKMITQAQS